MNKLFSKTAVEKLVNNIGQDKKKIFLLAIFVFACVYLDIRFILNAQLQALSKAVPKISKLQSGLASLALDLKKMEELKKKNGRQGAVAGAKKIISADQVVLLMERISSTANKYDVKVSQMRPQKEPLAKPGKGAKKERFTPLFLALDLDCDYHSLGKFLSELENSDIFLQAQEIKIEPKDTDYLRQKVALVLRTYVRE